MVHARILIVEDEGIIAKEIELRLQNLNYTVSGCAFSGEEAVERAAVTRPDLVLMDIRLKGKLDGITAAEQIRARFDIPIIYLTAHADQATLDRAKPTEPFGYLNKPFDQRELHTAVEIALHKHRIEKQLKENERWLAAVLGSIGEAVIATDRQGLVAYLNPIAAALVNCPQENVVGSPFSQVFDFVEDPTRLAVDDPVQAVLRDGSPLTSGKHTLLRVSGGARMPVEYTVAPIRDDQGNISGVVVIARDVTDRLEMERALLHNERLITMGQLAGALAHEINNPLQSITSSIDLILDYALEDHKRHEYLQRARRELERLKGFTRQMLDFSRMPGVDFQPIQISAAVQQALALTRKQLEDSRIHTNLSLPEGLPSILASHDRIVQVLLNLILNAVQVMPHGGELTISASETGKFIQLSVADQGPGIPPEAMGGLFQPFGTTKAGGSGLGLSISHSIIRQHGGTISAQNDTNGGAVFTITLPLAHPEVAGDSPHAPVC